MARSFIPADLLFPFKDLDSKFDIIQYVEVAHICIPYCNINASNMAPVALPDLVSV